MGRMDSRKCTPIHTGVKMKNKSQTVRIPRGCLWKSPHAMASNASGQKMYMCWPSLKDLSWLQDVKDVQANGDTPRFVTHQNGKFTWHFRLSCYHSDEGWWYDWDSERSVQRTETYRMFIPSKLEYHPDYTVPSDK